MTQLGYQERAARLQNSNFIDKLMANARAHIDTSRDDEGDEELPVDEETGDVIVPAPVPEEPEEDADDLAEANAGHISKETDEGEEDETADQTVSYKDAVRAFITMLLTNSMSTARDWTNNPALCEKCVSDDTIPADSPLKTKLWDEKKKLQNHLAGKFHSGLEKWKRGVEAATINKKYVCPYCLEIDPNQERSYHCMKLLLKHIRQDINVVGGNTARHNELKREAGWFDENCQGRRCLHRH